MPDVSTEIRNIDNNIRTLGGMLPQVLKDLEHYQDNHRFLLILSCAFAELMVSILVEKHCRHAPEINKQNRDYPLAVRLTILHELKVITDEHYARLTWLRKQRNDAAHRADFAFTKERMPNWADKYHQSPDKLFSLCVNLLGVFWNSHVELFRTKLPLTGLTPRKKR